MNKKKILNIFKSVIIVFIIVFFAFLLRAQAHDLSVIPSDSKDYYTDSSGLPYFSEMDSYYNLRITQNLMDYGHAGDEIINGTTWDSLSYGPPGREINYPPLISYITIFFYDLANTFDTFSLKEVAFWTGAIVASFAAIPAFIFVRRVTNDYGGIAAAVIVSLAPAYFSHTFAGFFDTDMFNVIFPIFIMLFFVESIKNDRLILRIIFAMLSLASLMLFSLAWTGYMFYAAVLVIFVIVYLIAGFYFKVDLIKPIKNYPNILQWFINQKEMFSIFLMIAVGFVGVTITGNLNNALNSVSGLIGATQIQALAQSTSYPNVYISVAELQVPNLLYGGIQGAFLSNAGGVVNGVGGIVALFGALILLFLLAQRLWKLKSARVGNKNKNKKAPKSERKAISKTKNKKENSFIEAIGGYVTQDQINKNKRETLLYLVLFVVWIGLSAVAVTQGSRFIQVLVLPFGLCAGIFVGYATTYVKNKINKNNTLMIIAIVSAALVAYAISAWNYPNYNIGYGLISFLIMGLVAGTIIFRTKKIDSSSKLKKGIVAVLITLALISPSIAGAYQTSYQVVPGTSDPMWNSMNWVAKNTTNDTVVTSWWDFGYLFEIASDRQVTFDGGSQNSPRAFWVGKAFTTSNEGLSAGIFRMLGSSGDMAYLTLDNYTNNTGKSVKILESTLPVSKDEAKNIMTGEYKLTSTQADTVLKYSHPDDPNPVVVVTSGDMLQKAGWWSYFGTWNFDIQNSTPYQYLAAQLPAVMDNKTGQANITNYQEGEMLYQTIIKKDSNNNTTATFEARYENGSKVTYPNGTVFEPMWNNEEMKIHNLMIIDGNQLIKNETVDENGKFSLLVFGSNGTYTSILMSRELENSMYTKLYLLSGFGQTSFKEAYFDDGVSLWLVDGSNSTSNS